MLLLATSRRRGGTAVGVLVAVGVTVAVAVGVRVAVGVSVAVLVRVGVRVGEGVLVARRTSVAVAVAVLVAVVVGVPVMVRVGVRVGVEVTTCAALAPSDSVCALAQTSNASAHTSSRRTITGPPGYSILKGCFLGISGGACCSCGWRATTYD
jgi:hypothetical protein